MNDINEEGEQNEDRTHQEEKPTNAPEGDIMNDLVEDNHQEHEERVNEDYVERERDRVVRVEVELVHIGMEMAKKLMLTQKCWTFKN